MYADIKTERFGGRQRNGATRTSALPGIWLWGSAWSQNKLPPPPHIAQSHEACGLIVCYMLERHCGGCCGGGAPHDLQLGGQRCPGEQRVPRAAQPPVLDRGRRLCDDVEAAGALQSPIIPKIRNPAVAACSGGHASICTRAMGLMLPWCHVQNVEASTGRCHHGRTPGSGGTMCVRIQHARN